MTKSDKAIRILLVDDETEFRDAAGQALRRQGFQVSEAGSGEHALELLPADRPDLVILDLKMGGMDGIATLTEIRKIDPDLPVLILTGHGRYEHALAGIQMGVVRSSPRRSQGAVSVSLGQARFETNRYYQAGLLDASDVWLWDYLLGGMTKSLSVPLAGVDGASSEAAQVRVVFQGASESGVEGEHHLRVWMNGTSLGETSFEGKRPHIFTA